MNDGSIVLFSSRYNLGRLEEITDRYYNADEDVYTTIENDTPEPTFPPARAPTSAPEPITPSPDNVTYQTINASINWVSPEEAVAMGLPGAITFPPELSGISDSNQYSNSSQAESNGSAERPQIEDDDSKQAPQQASPTKQKGDDSGDSNQATQQTEASEDPQIGDDDSDDSNQAPQQQTSMSNSGDKLHQGSGNQQVVGNGSHKGGTGSSSSASGNSSTGGYNSDAKSQQVLASGGNPYKQPTNERTSTSTMRRRETIQVKLIWGVNSVREKPSLWITDSGEKHSVVRNDDVSSPSLKLADPRTQEWLMTVVKMAKGNPNLFVREDKATWIERLRDYAYYAGVGFPIPERLFTTYLQLAKLKDDTFADLVDNEIGTSAPGLGGDFTFASIAMNVDAVLVANAAKNLSISEYIYKEWTDFAASTNELSSEEMPDVVAQSSIFLDAYRVEATIDSTLMTWFVANGLCLLVILVFIQNLALSVMVMVTIVLILLCLGGLFFAVYRLPFGPVEALGVSIFIGLSANYS